MLGKKVRCIVTGFEGIAVARIKYLNGCFQYQVESKSIKGNKVAESSTIDAERLKITGEGVNITQLK